MSKSSNRPSSDRGLSNGSIKLKSVRKIQDNDSRANSSRKNINARQYQKVFCHEGGQQIYKLFVNSLRGLDRFQFFKTTMQIRIPSNKSGSRIYRKYLMLCSTSSASNLMHDLKRERKNEAIDMILLGLDHPKKQVLDKKVILASDNPFKIQQFLHNNGFHHQKKLKLQEPEKFIATSSALIPSSPIEQRRQSQLRNQAPSFNHPFGFINNNSSQVQGNILSSQIYQETYSPKNQTQNIHKVESRTDFGINREYVSKKPIKKWIVDLGSKGQFQTLQENERQQRNFVMNSEKPSVNQSVSSSINGQSSKIIKIYNSRVKIPKPDHSKKKIQKQIESQQKIQYSSKIIYSSEQNLANQNHSKSIMKENNKQQFINMKQDNQLQSIKNSNGNHGSSEIDSLYKQSNITTKKVNVNRSYPVSNVESDKESDVVTSNRINIKSHSSKQLEQKQQNILTDDQTRATNIINVQNYSNRAQTVEKLQYHTLNHTNVPVEVVENFMQQPLRQEKEHANNIYKQNFHNERIQKKQVNIEPQIDDEQIRFLKYPKSRQVYTQNQEDRSYNVNYQPKQNSSYKNIQINQYQKPYKNKSYSRSGEEFYQQKSSSYRNNEQPPRVYQQYQYTQNYQPIQKSKYNKKQRKSILLGDQKNFDHTQSLRINEKDYDLNEYQKMTDQQGQTVYIKRTVQRIVGDNYQPMQSSIRSNINQPIQIPHRIIESKKAPRRQMRSQQVVVTRSIQPIPLAQYLEQKRKEEERLRSNNYKVKQRQSYNQYVRQQHEPTKSFSSNNQNNQYIYKKKQPQNHHEKYRKNDYQITKKEENRKLQRKNQQEQYYTTIQYQPIEQSKYKESKQHKQYYHPEQYHKKQNKYREQKQPKYIEDNVRYIHRSNQDGNKYQQFEKFQPREQQIYRKYQHKQQQHTGKQYYREPQASKKQKKSANKSKKINNYREYDYAHDNNPYYRKASNSQYIYSKQNPFQKEKNTAHYQSQYGNSFNPNNQSNQVESSESYYQSSNRFYQKPQQRQKRVYDEQQRIGYTNNGAFQPAKSYRMANEHIFYHDCHENLQAFVDAQFPDRFLFSTYENFSDLYQQVEASLIKKYLVLHGNVEPSHIEVDKFQKVYMLSSQYKTIPKVIGISSLEELCELLRDE